jgi:predicted AAA+ superfamily ATPase
MLIFINCLYLPKIIIMDLTELKHSQILKRLNIDNPWWTTGEIDSYFSAMTERPYINLLYPMVRETEVKRSVILMGPRRVGKTVMVYHCIKRLIAEGFNPKHIFYISVETPIYNRIPLEELFLAAKESVKESESKEPFYVFFDEIQYLNGWDIHLKSLVDTYKYVKFTATGSAAAVLKMKSNESGAGRFSDFALPPLTFYEYIKIKNLTQLITTSSDSAFPFDTINIDRLNESFIDYINYGGYPEVVFSDAIKANPGQYIRHDIIDKVLLRDLPSLYRISDVMELNSLFTMIAYQSGQEVSLENLSEDSGIKKETIKKYLQYLEAAFLIKVVHKTDENAKQFQRMTNFKIYLTNPSLRCALFEPIKTTDNEIGEMVETTVFAQWGHNNSTPIYYANWHSGRNKGEVDMVTLSISSQKPDKAVEIKWSDRYFSQPSELKSLLYFLDNNGLDEAMVTSITSNGIRKIGDKNLRFVPASLFTYSLGMKTIEQQKHQLSLDF